MGFDDADIARITNVARTGGIGAITDVILDPALIFRDIDRARAEEIRRWFRPMSVNAGVDTLLGFFDGISRDDDRDLLAWITAPALILASTAAQEVPAGVGLYLRQHIRGARLAELPGADHFAFATRPALFNLLVEQVLR